MGAAARGLPLSAAFLTALMCAACASGTGQRFASPVASLAGCYALNYGPWPAGLDEGEDRTHPDPAALPNVIELRTERVGDTSEPSVDGRIHEVRTHGRPGRGILHYWRMVDGNSAVVWTGGPVGFELSMGVRGRTVDGTVAILAEGTGGEVASAPLSGQRAPCPRQTPP